MLGHWKNGTISWATGESQQKEIVAQIGILVVIGDDAYAQLDYKYDGNPISYRVHLVPSISNLTGDKIWFFICPATGKRCRKLYLIGDYFLHRSAVKGLYRVQSYSKAFRKELKIWNYWKIREDMLGQLDKKYFKATYRGKATRRVQRMMNFAGKMRAM